MVNEKHYSLEYLESISSGDKDFILDMIQTFISNVPEELDKIRELVLDKNWNMAGHTAHKFASNLLFMENEELKSMAVQIEELGINETNTDEIPDLLKKLEQGCNIIIDELKRDFKI